MFIELFALIDILLKENQETFLIHVKTASDINQAFKRQGQIYIEKGTTLQPIPVIVGPLVNPLSILSICKRFYRNTDNLSSRNCTKSCRLEF